MDQKTMGKTVRVKLDYPHGSERPETGDLMEIAPGVHWVSMPLPFSLKWINLYLIEDGDGYALIDSGMNTPDTKAAWETIFDSVLDGKPVTRVICTHMHPDHVGMAGWVCERFNCELWMSRLEYLTCRMLIGDTGRPAPDNVVDFFAVAGWDEEALQKLRERFGSFGRAIYKFPDKFKRITDGDVLKIGDQDWRAVVGNGHSPEHVCLLNEELNLFISGDQLLPRISSNVSVHPTEPDANPLKSWLDSCAKLIAETPEGVLTLPSHNEPFYGGHKRLQALIDGHERSLVRLAEHIETPRRVVECFTVLFGRQIGSGDMYSATGEALAHLNCLIERGQARCESQDGVHLYSRVT